MVTSLTREMDEQRRWTLLPRTAHLTVFDRLVQNEFLSPEEQSRTVEQQCHRVLSFALANIPYYQKTFDQVKKPKPSCSLWQLLEHAPVLTKDDVHENEARFQPKALPSGETFFENTFSSGTTGRQTRIAHTRRSSAMFAILWQRQARWFRFDPYGTLATLRDAAQMPLTQGGDRLKRGETLTLPRWRYAGQYFETGPSIYFDVQCDPDAQIRWLMERTPEYLTAYSANLEMLAFAAQAQPPGACRLKAAIAIAQTLTPSMRDRILETLAGAVLQNYGLNEIGIVAVRCDAGRYHVHTEHCMVEIVSDEGRRCQPGETGRLLVTGFSNLAMPLIRYDTGDIAQAVEGPCACGRTLPSFGDVIGRTRRHALCPPGTMNWSFAMRHAIEDMPRDLVTNLRRYQLHQFRDGNFELRLQTVARPPDAFFERVMTAWKAVPAETPMLRIVERDIEKPPGGKFENFTSDFVQAPLS